MTDTNPDALAKTPLHALHVELGAKMVPFAGYDMPLHYQGGIIAEHLHTRGKAGLFDISHMGQALLAGADAARRLECLVPGDLLGLAQGRLRYTQLLHDDGTMLDDLTVARLAPAASGSEQLALVVNASRKAEDYAHLRRALPALSLVELGAQALLALQGPAAADILQRHAPDVAGMPFMSTRRVSLGGSIAHVSRSGYTGEDGFEISVPAERAEAVARRLLAEPEVKPVGLGARDTLRLEAGLCLYGHDIDATTTPIEAGLLWSISKRRRLEGGFPGDGRIREEIEHGPARRRVGLRLEGRAPAREGSDIATPEGLPVGKVTSGGFAPSLGVPIAMGYVAAAHAAAGTRLDLMVRGKPLPATIVPLPFVPSRYFKP